MNKNILFVDDDEKILSSFRRNLGDLYDISTARNGLEGLKALGAKGPFAVVVSDLKMPEMDGIEFLSLAMREHPNTVRVMLTGYADVDAAVSAVNENQIFRFLTKPCENRRLLKVLDSCIEQYRLVTSEKELLQGTLKGSIKMLTDVLSLIKPDVYGRVSRIIPYVKKICKILKDPSPWQTETAARLSLLGYITLPDSIIKRLNSGRPLYPEEQEIFGQHPMVAADLLKNIPRMDALVRIILYQNKQFNGSGAPFDDVSKEKIPLGSRILKVVLDFDILLSSGISSKKEALNALKRQVGVHDPNVLAALEKALGDEAKYHILEVNVHDLRDRMILMEDITLTRGGNQIKVLSRGQEIHGTARQYLRKYLDQGFIGQSVKVVEPLLEETGGNDN